MTLITNGIDISKLPIKIEKFGHTLEYFQKKSTAMLKRIEENAKKGIVVFTDNNNETYTKEKLKVDF